MPWDKSYNETDVLSRAMEAFWARGYEATSMADLVSATGINRGSIYAAFTDKHTLFVRALKHYDQHHRSDFLANVRRTHGPKEAIFAVFRSAVETASGERTRSGCLLVNTALELSPHDEEVEEIIRVSFVELEEFFKAAIEDAQGDGDIDSAKDAAETAQALLGLFLGLRVLSRARPEKKLLNSISKQAAVLMN